MTWAALKPVGAPVGRPAAVPGSSARAPDVAGGVTSGVEEEFLLLDPATGSPVLAAPDLLRVLDGEPGVHHELMRFQVRSVPCQASPAQGPRSSMCRPSARRP